VGGEFFAQEGNVEEARTLSLKAQEVAPNSGVVSNHLAYLYLEHGGDINQAL
jgi:Flp pilus assembly protein TadD